MYSWFGLESKGRKFRKTKIISSRVHQRTDVNAGSGDDFSVETKPLFLDLDAGWMG